MNASKPHKTIWANPYVLFAWGIVVAVLSYIFVFEKLPLPTGVTPPETILFTQVGGSATTVDLPDNWRSFPERPVKTGVYSTEFSSPDVDERWAIYVPRYSGQIRVSVNGVELTPGGFLSGELIADQSVPFFSPISRNILNPGTNNVEITIVPGGILVGFLGDVYIGSEDLLRASFDWHYLRAVRLPELVVFWQLLLALLLLVLWLSRRNEHAASYCSLILVFSSLHGLPVYLPSSVIIANAVALLGLVMNFWLSVIGLLFVYSLTDRQLPVKARYLLFLPTLATVGFLTLPAPIFSYLDKVAVVPFSLIVMIWIVYILLHSTIRERRWESMLILLSVLGACSLAIHDTLIIANVNEGSNFLHFRIVYILILPALSVIFFQRFIHSMNHADHLVRTLEERIEDKENELREQFSQRQVLEGRQVLNEERQRIMRDVHDGLGGRLMSIIAMSRLEKTDPDAIESSAQEALEELRMLIGSMDVERDISGMLGTFRERAEQQLSLHGIELDWRMIDIPAIDGLNPTRALNVLRILQEATTNAAKHSGADKVSIRFQLPPGSDKILVIEIEDNGRGLEHPFQTGHGLKNMRDRAHEFDGDLKVESSAQGTKITFALPVSMEPGEA